MGVLFKEKFPERHFDMGIAEQNLMSVAAEWHWQVKFHSPPHLLCLLQAVRTIS